MAKHDFFWAGDGDLPVQPPGRDREQGKGESAHSGRGQFGCRARAVGKARAGKPSTRAGFQKERSATAKQAPRRPSSQVRLAGEGKPAMQSAQTRKLRLWERVQQRYSTKLSGYATKPVRPIQTSYARAVQPSKFNMHRVPKPTSYAYGMGYRQVSAQHGNKQCRAEQGKSASTQV